MTREDIKRYILSWLEARGVAAEGLVTEGDIFESGLVDSFSVFELIENLEERFSVRFTEEHFRDRKFRTISGISEIVHHLSED